MLTQAGSSYRNKIPQWSADCALTSNAIIVCSSNVRRRLNYSKTFLPAMTISPTLRHIPTWPRTSEIISSSPRGPADSFHKFLQSLANFIGRVFLQEVRALDCDFCLVQPGSAEVECATLHDSSGF